MSLDSLQRFLILFGLVLVPFISIGELLALFTGNLISQTSNLTGGFKFSKDAIFILLILIGGVDLMVKDKLSIKALIYFSILLLLIVPSLLLSLGSEIIYLAAGIRWIIPVILPVFLFFAVDEKLVIKISKYVFFLLLVHLIMQILQLLFAGSWFGTSAFGFNLRNPGLFLIPNTGAFFTIICLYIILFISGFSGRKKTLVISISTLSIFLTLSGTGLIVLLFVLFLYYARINKLKWFVFLIPVALLFMILFVSFLQTRDANYVEVSGGTRLSIFINSLVESNLFSSDFGLGTNSAVLLGKGEIMDSTFASLVVNLGYLGFFLTLGGIFLFLLYSVINGNKPLFVFISIYALFAFTTIIFEVYPANLLMAVLLVFFMKKEKNQIFLSEQA